MPVSKNTTSIITISSQQHQIFAINQDGSNVNSTVKIIPNSSDNYGCVLFGQDENFPEGGMNEEGLCFHIAKTPESMLYYSSEKEYFEGNPLEEFLPKCSKIGEVIALYQKYNIPGMEDTQIMVADKTGNAVVIGVGNDNELSFTYKKNDSLLLTNFNLAHPETGNHPCIRYSIASDMVDNLSEISIPLIRNILSATHIEGQIATVYSLVYDLLSGNIYLFYYHDFGNGVKFNLRDALRKENDERVIPFKSLFHQKINYYAEIVTRSNSHSNEDGQGALKKEMDINSINISNITSIGELYARQLNSIGIATISDIIEQCSTPDGRKCIAELSGISTKLLLEWVNHAIFHKINSINSVDIEYLEKLGIDTVSELAQQNPEELFQKMLDSSDEELPDHISFSTISSWIEQAKSIPAIVRYH